MSVRNAGKAIQEARKKAGLTQEQLSDGICSVLSLSRIENCSAGVSPSTFRALMSRAGVECETYPVFADRTDFDCFYTLKRARFYLEAWQFQDAYDQLCSVQNMNWADNRFYYQEWLLLQYQILFHNQSISHVELYDLLKEAIMISCPNFDIDHITKLLLSTLELELLIAIAQETLYLNHPEQSGYLCAQIENYLTNSQLTSLEKECLLAQNAIIYTKYLLAVKDYATALKKADHYRHQMVLNNENSLLFELTFLTALGYFYTNNKEQFFTLFQTVFYSSHALNSCYATTVRDYVRSVLGVTLNTDMEAFPDIPYQQYPMPKTKDTVHLHDGIFNADSNSIMYFGDLIRELRQEQKLSQQIVCQGLCSKSKLSKIENNYLQPDIALAEALLQRLGISERVFTFWGSEDETQFHHLKLRLQHLRRDELQIYSDYLSQLKHTLNPKNNLQKQYFLLRSLVFIKDNDKAIETAYKALHLTNPDFCFEIIQSKRLSWNELTLLNLITMTMDDSQKSYYNALHFSYILDYFKKKQTDIIFQNSIYPVTLAFFMRSLLAQKHIKEILEINYYHSTLYHSPFFLGLCIGCHCQALGLSRQHKQAKEKAHYAISLFQLCECPENADLIKTCLKKDFQNIEFLTA